MAQYYQSAQKFYNDIAKLCKSDCYNLVLHKHLGDVFYAIAARDEFEVKYNAKLRFIIRPNMEFLMHMFGIKDYSVYNMKWFEEEIKFAYFPYMPAGGHESHQFDMVCKDIFLSIPIAGTPFIADSDITPFFKFSHFWSFIWATNIGISDDFKFQIPKYIPKLSSSAEKTLKKFAPLNKIVLIAPEAATATEFPQEFWDTIAKNVHNRGYKIIVNSKKYKIKYGKSAFNMGLSLSDIVSVGLQCAYVFSIRSGLTDVLVGAREKMFVFYPAMLRREMGGLNKCFEQLSNVNEVSVCRWKIDSVIWENINITHDLQKHINSLHRMFVFEKTMAFLTTLFRDKRNEHKLLYHTFNNIAGIGKIFSENNMENIPRFENKLSFFGFPIYAKKYVQEKQGLYVIRHIILGGIFRIKIGKKFSKLSLFGLSVFTNNREIIKLFGISIKKYSSVKRWISELQSKINKKYDDIYILRHNIGETYVELMHLEQRIKNNKSKHPLVIVRDKKYFGLYKMFLPVDIDVKYIELDQTETRKTFEKLSFIKSGKQRFLCSTPLVAQNMKALLETNPKINFYDYINKSVGIKKGLIPKMPKPSDFAIRHVESKIKQIELGKKFIILCPEANSLTKIENIFWETLAKSLHKKGYDILLNSQNMQIKGTKNIRTTIEETFILARKSCGIITLGSGISVYLTAANVPMDIIYTGFNNKNIGYDSAMVIQIYSVFHLPNVSHNLVKEYNTDNIKNDDLTQTILRRY